MGEFGPLNTSNYIYAERGLFLILLQLVMTMTIYMCLYTIDGPPVSFSTNFVARASRLDNFARVFWLSLCFEH